MVELEHGRALDDEVDGLLTVQAADVAFAVGHLVVVGRFEGDVSGVSDHQPGDQVVVELRPGSRCRTRAKGKSKDPK